MIKQIMVFAGFKVFEVDFFYLLTEPLNFKGFAKVAQKFCRFLATLLCPCSD